MLFAGFILIVFLSFLVLFPTFNLGLWGDDWLAIYNYFIQLAGRKSTLLTNLDILIKDPWGSQTLTMGLFYKLFQFNSFPYFLISYILRTGAALTLYPVIFLISKNRLLSLLGTLFFAVSVTGLDASSMAFNSISFLSIIFFNLFIYFYIKQILEFRKKLVVLSVLFFFLAYVSRPIRMVTILPLVIFMELFLIIKRVNNTKQGRVQDKLNNGKSYLRGLVRITLFSIVFILPSLVSIKNSSIPGQGFKYWLEGGSGIINLLINEKKIDFLFNPLISIGNAFFPFPMFLDSHGLHGNREILIVLITSLISFVIFLKFISKCKCLSQSNILPYLVTMGCIWQAVIYFLYKTIPTYFSSFNLIVSLTYSGFILLLWMFLIYIFRSRLIITMGLFLSLLWTILSSIIGWWWTPANIYEPTHRYLIVTVIPISMFISILISILDNRKIKIITIVLFLLLITAHIAATEKYLSTEIYGHGQSITAKIWSTIPRFDDVNKLKKPLVFYFEGSNLNSKIIYQSITYGFPSHMSLLNGFGPDETVPLTYWNELENAVSDGGVLVAYGHPHKPIPIDQVYAFRFEGQDDLVNITDEVRNKLNNDK